MILSANFEEINSEFTADFGEMESAIDADFGEVQEVVVTIGEFGEVSVLDDGDGNILVSGMAVTYDGTGELHFAKVNYAKVDSELSETSKNPVQNRVIAKKIIEIETTVGNVDALLATI